MPSCRLPTSYLPLSVGFAHAAAVCFPDPDQRPYPTSGDFRGVKSLASDGGFSLFPRDPCTCCPWQVASQFIGASEDSGGKPLRQDAIWSLTAVPARRFLDLSLCRSTRGRTPDSSQASCHPSRNPLETSLRRDPPPSRLVNPE